MARDIESAKLTRWVNAISNTAGVKTIVRAEVYASRIFFSSITSNYPWSGAEGTGMNDTPQQQCAGYNSNNDTVTTFRNDSGTLKYMTPGNATPVTTSYTSVVGNPSVFGNYLYLIRGTNIYRYTISWTLITSRNTNPLSGAITIGAVSNPLNIHAVANNQCVVIRDGDGGFYAVAYLNVDSTPVNYTTQGRFMFPKFVDYTDGGSERTMASLAAFSSALKLGDNIYVYMSDNYAGSVVACGFNVYTLVWGDIFTAVPTDLKNSMCEFRVANAYERNGTAYLVGQYHRTENIGTDNYYSMILSSSNGRSFSLDRFCLVSDLGYRFHAVCGTDTLFLTHCNRVCYADITYNFDGVNGTSGSKISIPGTSIKQFKDSNLQRASIELEAGDESLTFDALVEEENMVRVYFGYVTTNGEEDELYGTYIINGIAKSFADGQRTLSLQLINETEWRLAGLSSPFYTEIFSKSSGAANFMLENTGEMYCAEGVYFVQDGFSVDFWSSEPHSDTGITGINVLDGGGVSHYETTGLHDLGVRTTEVKDILGLATRPVITATSITAKLYGWSHSVSGSLADQAELILVVRDPETSSTSNKYSVMGYRWPNTYPTPASGNDPITVTVSGLTVGHEIVKVGMQVKCTEATWFCVERVEITSGARIYISPTDGNTPWEFESVPPNVPPPARGIASLGLMVPGKGRPYIMFAQRPFDAYNFKIAATFNDTASIPSTSYVVGAGLVGLAENGQNYIVARFNRSPDSDGQFEIVKVRDGVETILATGANPNYAEAPDYRLMFEHIDGKFTLWEWDYTDKEWQAGLSYTWQASDGWMYTSDTAVKKCGIYGLRDAPKFRIPGFYLAADQEDESPSDGIAALPTESLTDLASSGEVEINGSVYTYTAKVTHPTVPRGPYQLRQSGVYGSDYGAENRYFNWTAATNLYAGKLISIDNGYTFIVSSSLFQVGTDYNRSRHYSTNQTIGNASVSTSNRTYITGGLTGINITSGEQEKHLHNTLCLQRSTGEIYCRDYSGSNGDVDATVEDLIEKIIISAGGAVSFPGDVVVASQAISGDYLVGTLDHTEGFDIRFTVPYRTTISLKVDVVPEVPYMVGTTQLQVKIEHLGTDNYEISLIELPSGTVVEKRQLLFQTGRNDFRILFHDDYITLYMSDRWIHTFANGGITTLGTGLVYPATTHIYLNGTLTVTNIRLLDLCDWREAIYIDLETDGMSAIGNVVQERPVEYFCLPDGSVSYSYDMTRDQMAMLYEPREHRWAESPPEKSASDAIVYSAKDVKCLQLQNFAANYGFSTKVYRFPNLNVGAYRAANVLLQRIYEQSIMHELQMRPDARLLPGDVYQIDYSTSGTGTAIDEDIVVESIDLVIGNKASPTMLIRGRQI